MGDWAKNNSVTEGKYIDPTMTPSPTAWQSQPNRFLKARLSKPPAFKVLAKRALG
jgi:hypothetical protein